MRPITRRIALASTFAATTAVVGIILSDRAAAQPKVDPENTLYMDLKNGRVVIQLLPDLAPKHVERMKMLAREHF